MENVAKMVAESVGKKDGNVFILVGSKALHIHSLDSEEKVTVNLPRKELDKILDLLCRIPFK